MLGLDIKHKDGDILMSQNKYIEAKIDHINITVPKNDTEEELNPEQKKILWGMIGKCRLQRIRAFDSTKKSYI